MRLVLIADEIDEMILFESSEDEEDALLKLAMLLELFFLEDLEDLEDTVEDAEDEDLCLDDAIDMISLLFEFINISAPKISDVLIFYTSYSSYAL